MAGFSHDLFLIAFVLVFAIAGAGYLVASHADTCPPVSGTTSGTVSTVTSGVSSPTCPPVSGPVSGPTLAPGEQLSTPPQRRPAQYLHVCIRSGITYVSQGTPNCLAGGTFEFNYSPSVPGTFYSIPCSAATTAGLRYVYIAAGEVCPTDTKPLVLAPGEQLSLPPQRRPAQYVHVCTVPTAYSVTSPGVANSVQRISTLTTYVSQGTPNCLPGGTFRYDYDPSVPGTVYSIPCGTTTGASLRYIYISTGEKCPAGSVLVTPQG